MGAKEYKRPPRFREKTSRKFTPFKNYKMFENGRLNTDYPPEYNVLTGCPDKGKSIPRTVLMADVEIGSLK